MQPAALPHSGPPRLIRTSTTSRAKSSSGLDGLQIWQPPDATSLRSGCPHDGRQPSCRQSNLAADHGETPSLCPRGVGIRQVLASGNGQYNAGPPLTATSLLPLPQVAGGLAAAETALKRTLEIAGVSDPDRHCRPLSSRVPRPSSPFLPSGLRNLGRVCAKCRRSVAVAGLSVSLSTLTRRPLASPRVRRRRIGGGRCKTKLQSTCKTAAHWARRGPRGEAERSPGGSSLPEGRPMRRNCSISPL